MLGIDTRTARVVWTACLILLAIELAWLARTTILVFTIALLLAYLLNPLVQLVRRFLPPRAPYPLAAAIVYLAGAAILTTATLLIGTRIAEEAAQLASRLPQLIEQRDTLLERNLPDVLAPYREQIRAAVSAQLEGGKELLLPALTSVGSGILHRLSSALYVVLIPILAFLLQLSMQELRTTAVSIFDGTAYHRLGEAIVRDIDILLGLYMRAVFLLALATFTSHMLFYLAIGVPYAVLLAGICGILEFIPVVGPLSAALIAVSVAGFSGYPHPGWIILFAIIYRLFQDYVLQPWLFSSGIEMHPLLVLFGVLAGEQIGGVTGMFLSVPMLAMLRIVYRHTIAHASVERVGD